MTKKKERKIQYSFREGLRHRASLDPQAVGEALEEIREERGFLLPEAVVEAAEAEDHPAHPAFTWDDLLAASRYRLYEARHLIRSIKLVAPKQAEPVNAFYNVRLAPVDTVARSYYQSAVVIAQNPAEFSSALEYLLAKIGAAQRAAESLERAAEKSKLTDQLGMITIALKSLATAHDAVRGLAVH